MTAVCARPTAPPSGRCAVLPSGVGKWAFAGFDTSERRAAAVYTLMQPADLRSTGKRPPLPCYPKSSPHSLPDAYLANITKVLYMTFF